MIDLNHGSGCLYGQDAPRPPIASAVSAAIDGALTARNRAERPRTYVSSSGLGRDCLRQIQYDYLAVPKDEGQEFEPRILRIFEAGHRAEDIVAGWFRIAGFDLRTERPDGRQFGFEAMAGRFKGHIDGCFVSGPLAMDYPALWENKALGASSWKDVVKRGVSLARPVYAAQIALYQAYMEGTVPGISAAPALFTAINKDTAEMHHELVPFDADLAQRMSDRGVRILQATDAGELLPRVATTPDFFECRFCPWAERCWRLAA